MITKLISLISFKINNYYYRLFLNCNRTNTFYGKIIIYNRKNILIQNNCSFNDLCHLNVGSNSKLEIHNNVSISAGAFITTVGQNLDNWPKMIHTEKNIIINEGSWIGPKSIIFPGVTIGKYSVIAAGSVITNDVDDYSLMGGNPARKIRNLK